MPDLTGIPALDFAIGLSFIYLLLSLFCSAIQEAIAGVFALRAHTLAKGLKNMLEDHGKNQSAPTPAPGEPAAVPLALEVLGNPLIRTLYKDTRIGLRKHLVFIGKVENKAPSYIAPRAFALALIDTLKPNLETTDDTGKPLPSHDVVKQLRDEVAANTLLPAKTKEALLRIIDDARGDVDRVRQNIEAWFDDSMARVSGWYKRKAQLILCVIALLVTVIMNADTIAMGQRLWKDDAVRTAVVDAALKSTAPVAAVGPTGASGPTGETGPTAGGGAAAEQSMTGPTGRQSALDKAADDIDNVKKLGVPLGWNDDATDPRNLDGAKQIASKILGWLFTFIALSLGAPFWFDTLSRLARLRNSGKPESPLPASSFGKPNERVADPALPASGPGVTITSSPPPSGGTTSTTTTQTTQGGGPSTD
jgi:hypothetical protein